MEQKPDTKTGNYYVTVIRGGRIAKLLGPFRDDHAAALMMVDAARREAERRDPRMAFDAFGTTRYPAEIDAPGALNAVFGLPTEPATC